MIGKWMRRFGVWIVLAILALTIIGVWASRNQPNRERMVSLQTGKQATEMVSTKTKRTEPEELLAVWVPYFSIDRSGAKDKSEKAFQAMFDEIIKNAKAKKMNALIVQVRPFGDAFYPSSYYPWSSYLTGTQGVDPGYDPLEYMVRASHEAGLQFHAWLNPLRIRFNESPQNLADTNPYSLWKDDPEKAEWCLSWEQPKGLYLNPGIKEVRQYITDGVGEIVKNYDVDGIHFDDYFYPTEDGSYDAETYQAYCDSIEEGKVPLSQSEWRKQNINELLLLVYQTVKREKQDVVFGVAPQGNIDNDERMGADVKTWCSTPGYVDYICPQLYVNFDHPVLPFDEGARQWKEMTANSGVKLYLGLGVYKASSDVDSGTWKESNEILAQEVAFGRHLGCDGFLFYSYESICSETAREEVENVLKIL